MRQPSHCRSKELVQLSCGWAHIVPHNTTPGLLESCSLNSVSLSSLWIQPRICKCVCVRMDPVGIYTCLGNAALQHGILSAFDSSLWMQASVSRPYVPWGCQQSLGRLAGCQLSSPLLEEYYSSKAVENCDIFEGGHCMRSAWYASSPTWRVFHSKDFFIVSVLVNICQGTQRSFLFSIPFFFSFCFLYLHTQSPQLPSTGFLSLLISGESKSWSNAVGHSLLPSSTDLGHRAKSRVPGTGGVILYQAWN